MTELVRGQISDRPWGLTFCQLGLRELTGQLTVHAGDRRTYRVAFAGGAIVGATSPQPADAATRIAMTSGLITSSQVAVVARQIATTPEIDEIALLAAACRLVPEQIAKLRRRVILQRAARTFSIEEGGFVVEDEITIATAPDAAVDVRSAVYQGARLNLSELRLIGELRALGSHFTLGETALERAEWFGFDAQVMPVLEALRGGATLPEIEAKHREIDPRTVQSVIYALASCLEVVALQDAAPPIQDAAPPVTADISVSFKAVGGGVSRSRTETTKGSTPSSLTPPAPTAEQEFRASTGTRNDAPPLRRPYADDSTPLARRSPTSPPPISPAPATDVDPARPKSETAPWRARTPSSPPPTSPPLRPKPPSSPPTSPVLRPKSPSSPPGAVPSEGTDRVTQSFEEANAAFRRGIEALHANQLPLAIEQLTRASTLNPHEFDHSAMLAFAQLVHAPPAERQRSADKVRKMLSHATQKSKQPAQALVYLGQLEHLLGNDKQARLHFEAALASQPQHPQAQRELRELEDRALEKSGLGLFKKK